MNKNKKRLLIYIGLILLAVLVGMVYYMNSNKLVDYNKLEEKLPEKQMTATATITKIDKLNAVKIRSKSYGRGYLYTYVFSAKNKKYMGNFFTKTKAFEINEKIYIIYLPENPSVNQYKE